MSVQALRKKMLVMECDAKRLMMAEEWSHVAGTWKELGSYGTGQGGFRQWGALLAPLGAFALTRWLRRSRAQSDSEQLPRSEAGWQFLSLLFDWMARMQRR